MVRFFAVDPDGTRTEITDLYWFEENGIHTLGEDTYGTRVEVELPRCDGCRWWTIDHDSQWTGLCSMNDRHFKRMTMWVSEDTTNYIATSCDFGCVQWEAKPDGR